MSWHDFILILSTIALTRIFMWSWNTYKIRKNVWTCPFDDLTFSARVMPRYVRDKLIEVHMDHHRECKGGNSNICVAEGCFARQECIDMNLKKFREGKIE